MPTNTLKIAPGLSLDADYIAGASLALLGKRGAGKTYASRVLAECLFDAHVQTVIIDPMGVFWGLRSSADGEQEGLPIPVFGGEHGDAPLESSAGALMADLVVDEGLSMVLDLSGFGSRTQERTFAAAFLDRLYRTNRDLVHLIVDEADLFAPQKPRREDAHLLVTMENIVRRGRNRGIGITMASQRAAVLNKDVLTQIDGLAALRVAAPQDRDAIREWVRGQGDEETWSQIAPSLPSLANGESWWWIPEKGVLKKEQVRKSRTFDSSPTRKRGNSSRAPKTFADVDLKAIHTRITATIERAKADDPRELRRQIRELEKSLAARDQREPARESVTGEVPVLSAEVSGRLEASIRVLVDAQTVAAASADELRRASEAHQEAVRSVAAAADAIRAAVTTELSPAVAQSRVPAPQVRPPADAGRQAVRQRRSVPEEATSVAPARQRLLDALASLEGIGIFAAGKIQLALWAGVSPKSSGYANNLGALRSAGLIGYPAPGTISLTPDGRDVSAEPEVIATEAELHEKVRGLISPARWRLLSALIEAYPFALTKAELAEAAGVSQSSSGYANNLGALRSLGLLDYPTPGTVAATGALFLSGVQAPILPS